MLHSYEGTMLGMTTRWGLFLGSATIALGANSAIAQITSDGTLPNNSIVTPDGSTLNINGGTIAGSNLFHSFREFSVPSGGTAIFNNAANIQNIFSRVTGGSVSNIDGVILTSGTANLFLINPSGIIFGQNASLNIGGSFVATTASAIQFGDRSFFSASNPDASTPLLTINPTALFYTQIPAPIENNSIAPNGRGPAGFPVRGLRVPDGKSLLLIGGNINMNGGQLNAYGGRIELSGLANTGSVALNVNGDNLRSGFPTESAFADVLLSNGARLQVEAGGGGSVVVNARNIDITNGSRLSAGIGFGLGSGSVVAGDITLNAKGEINIKNRSAISSNVLPQGTGNAGNVNITATKLSVSDAQLQAVTFGQGDAGNVIIGVRRSVSFDNNGVAFSTVEPGGVGNGGNIQISADSLFVTSGAQLQAITLGQGDAGNVIINARGRVSFDGTSSDGGFISAAGSTVELGAVGNGGNIQISADSLSLTNDAQFNTYTRGKGDAGNIKISTDSLSLTNGARLQTLTSGQGDAGNIEINASDFTSVSGISSITEFSSALLTSTFSNSIGKGGDIIVNTSTLRVSDGAVLDARTNNNRNGGNITLNVKQALILNGGQVLSTSSSAGNAGKITINATDRVIVNGGNSAFNDRVAKFDTAAQPINANSGLFVRAQSIGSAGNIEVTTPQILLDNTVRLNAESESGNGGDITLNIADLLLLRRGSRISTSAGDDRNGGNGGNITINVSNGFIVAVPNENSDIAANAYTGNGGRVKIKASAIYGTQFRNLENRLTSDITASSEFGADGNVELITPGIDPNRGLVPLTTDVVDVASLVDDNICARTANSSFTYTGRGGLPPSPNNRLNSDAVWEDWRLTAVPYERPTTAKKPIAPKLTTPEPIVEATGWIKNEKGEIELTANPPTVTPNGSGTNPVSCRA